MGLNRLWTVVERDRVVQEGVEDLKVY